MRYATFDVDIAAPLVDLPLASSDAGAAVLVRRKGVPIGFWMEPTHGAVCLRANDLERRIAADLRERIVAEAVREQLTAGREEPSVLPSLTIAICTRDRPAYVERLLQALCEQVAHLPGGQRAPEILLVDNAPSDDGTRSLARRFAQVRYVLEVRPGLNFARNRAVAAATGDWLSFLDDDVVTDAGWLSGLASAWTANPDAAAFTGQVLPLELETRAQIIFERRGGFRRGFDTVRHGAVSSESLYPGGAGSFGAGANMIIRTEVLKALGGFDEALDTGAAVPGGGDLDIFYRLIRGGHVLVYEPRLLAFHQHRREMSALGRQYRRSWGLGFMCYLAKCLRTDPERRFNLLRLAYWWFVHHTSGLLRHIKRRARGLEHIPPTMLAGELWGGVCGLLGGYSRSQRRVDAVRRQFR